MLQQQFCYGFFKGGKGQLTFLKYNGIFGAGKYHNFQFFFKCTLLDVFYVVFFCRVEECGGKVTTAIGWLSSPGYPDVKHRNINCTWDITAPDGELVVLTVTDLQIDIVLPKEEGCRLDWLAVGFTNTSEKNVTMCHPDDKNRNITAPSNFMQLFYFSSCQNVEGFNVTLSTKDATTTTTGQQTPTEPTTPPTEPTTTLPPTSEETTTTATVPTIFTERTPTEPTATPQTTTDETSTGNVPRTSTEPTPTPTGPTPTPTEPTTTPPSEETSTGNVPTTTTEPTSNTHRTDTNTQ
uniref:CUB domain-containing protein n=1 Tax=Eptatretus burgeri TaxID=7764 RepID=A0A8C4QE90_EPTBU